MRRALLLLLLALALPTLPAYAEPIIFITGGSLVVGVDNVGTLNLQGTHGFEAVLLGGALGHFGTQCRPCGPGDSLDLGGALEDASGALNLAGLHLSPNFVQFDVNGFRFEGTATVPPLSSDGIVSVPFEFPGELLAFNPFPEGESTLTFPVIGHGTATVQFVLNPSVPVWEFNGSRFDFESTVTPEPTTLLLVGSGIAAVCRRRQRVFTWKG